MVFFFAIHRVVNVVIAPNAMIGEWRNCFECAPGATFRGGLKVLTAGVGGGDGGGGVCDV